LYCYFVSQSSEFCRHNRFCCFSTSVYCCLFRYDSVWKLLGTPSYVSMARCLVKHRANLLYFPLKVKSLHLTKHHAMKTYWEVEVYLHAVLTSALGGGEWSASRPGRFTPRERVPGTQCIGGCVGPRAGLDTVSKRKFPAPARNRTPIIRSCSP
jgi:hypothetical protein